MCSSLTKNQLAKKPGPKNYGFTICAPTRTSPSKPACYNAPTWTNLSPATTPKIAWIANPHGAKTIRMVAGELFDYQELIARDKANLDIFWLRDKSLEDSANLPAPEVLAQEIANDLEVALERNFAGCWRGWRCTAPVRGHRTASGRAACPACGGGSRGYGGYVVLRPSSTRPTPRRAAAGVARAVAADPAAVQGHAGRERVRPCRTRLPKCSHSHQSAKPLNPSSGAT